MAITLKEAFALNGTPDLTSFKDLQEQCKNTDYFTDSNLINELSSWEGYYYLIRNRVDSIVLNTFNISASGGTIIVTYQINNQWSNDTQTGAYGITPTVSSTIGTVSDITATNSYGSGTAKITIDSLGSIVQDSTTGTISVSISGSNKSTNFTIEENARTLSSVYFIPYEPDDTWGVDVENGNWTTCPASGGYIKAYGYANYTHTSGVSLNDQLITSDADLTWSSGYDSWITSNINGGYHIQSRGTTDGPERSSNATWIYGGKTSDPKTLKQEANNWWDDSFKIDTSVPNIAASGGETTFIAKIQRAYTSGDKSGFIYNVSVDTRFTSNANWLRTSAIMGTADNNTSEFAREATVTGVYGSFSASCIIRQEAGVQTSSIVDFGVPTSANIGSGLSAAGGSATVSASVTNTRYWYWNGIHTSTDYPAGSVSYKLQSNGNNRFSLNGSTVSHSSMGTLDTTDTVVIRVYNNDDNSKYVDVQQNIINSITSYNNPTFDMWWSTGTGSTSTPVSAGGGTSSAPTYSVYQTAVYSSGDTGEITPNITYKQFSIVSKDTAATASINESTGAVTFGTLGKTEQNANTHAVVKLTITSHGKTVSDEGFCHQAPNYKTPVYGDINIFDFYYATITYNGTDISPHCRYTQTCSYSYSSGETESASNVSGQAGDGYTSFQRISGDSSASINSSTGLVTWGVNSGSERSATIRVTVTRNGKTSTKDASTTQTGAPTYGSWEFVGISSNTIDPIPVWENAVFTCTYRRTTPSGGYETRNGTCSPSEYYNDGSGGSVWVSYYDPDGRYGGQKQFMLDSE